MNSTQSIPQSFILWKRVVDYTFFTVFIFCVLLFFLPALAIAQTSGSYCPELLLTFGSGAKDTTTGGQVSSLQQFLLHYGAGTSTQLVTGYFGIITERNLIQFQVQQHLVPSGVLDTFTRAAIAIVCGTTATTTPAQIVPSATLDNNPLTSLQANVFLSGTATHLNAPLSILITHINAGGGSNKMYENDAIPVVQNRWAVTVSPPLSEGVYTATLSSGDIFLASSTLTIGLKSLPTVELDTSLPQFDVVDGRLMRFKIMAKPTGAIGINQFTFTIAANSADVTSVALYGYSDPGYSQPIASTTAGVLSTSVVDPTPSAPAVILPMSLEIPAGQIYYFELDGTVTPSDTTYSVITTLLGDAASTTVGTATQLASSSNFIWSPNTYATSSVTDADWTNGSIVSGLPQSGIIQSRTNSFSLTPTCTLSASTSTIASNQPVTLNWTSSNATYSVWDDGMISVAAGGRTFNNIFSTRTFILNFYGPNGTTICFTTVAFNQPISLDKFSASPISGTVPLAVTFNGSVNNAKSCVSATYTFSYGDGHTNQISVPVNSCKSQSFKLVYTYQNIGTFGAALYKGIFSSTSTPQLLQIQSITVQSKITFNIDPSSAIANVLSAFGGHFLAWTQWLSRIFRW